LEGVSRHATPCSIATIWCVFSSVAMTATSGIESLAPPGFWQAAVGHRVGRGKAPAHQRALILTHIWPCKIVSGGSAVEHNL
jgi:hypothetical protein